MIKNVKMVKPREIEGLVCDCGKAVEIQTVPSSTFVCESCCTEYTVLVK